MLYVGVDFGRTPAAAIAQRQVDGSWWVLDEIVTENCSAYDFGRILKDYIAQNYPNSPTEIYCDPAGMQKGQASDDTPILMLEKWGFDVMPAPSNKFEARKGALDSILGQMIGGETAIGFDPKCRTLIKSLSGAYQFSRIKVSEMSATKTSLRRILSRIFAGVALLLLSMEGQIFGHQYQFDDFSMTRDLAYMVITRQPDEEAKREYLRKA